MRLATIICMIAAPALGQNLEEGKAAYIDHCAGCHGAEALGDGPLSGLLSVQPADLTQIASENGGVFPTGRVVRRIDGNEDMLAHGGPMPVFGPLLQGPSLAILTPGGDEVVAPEGIANIAAWLEEIQE